MANNALWACLGLLGLATLVFLLGVVGAGKHWFDLSVAGSLTTWSFGAIIVFAGAVSCLLPYYEGR